MNQIIILAGKEIRDGLRNRWVVMTALAMAGLAFSLSFLGSTPTGTTKVSELAVIIVSLSSLSIFFIPLIALLLSVDTIVGESERGTLLLLLAYPVSRWQIIVGKFAGQFLLLSGAIIAGYGAAGLSIALGGGNVLRLLVKASVAHCCCCWPIRFRAGRLSSESFQVNFCYCPGR